LTVVKVVAYIGTYGICKGRVLIFYLEFSSWKNFCMLYKAEDREMLKGCLMKRRLVVVVVEEG